MMAEVKEGILAFRTSTMTSNFRSNDVKKFIEKYCSNCRNFLPEEPDGSVSTFDPSEKGVPDYLIYELSPGCSPYEFRKCDATYIPNGKGGCKNYIEGRLLLFSRAIGVIRSKPLQKS